MVYRLGQQVGNYRLVRQIGHGGFADVYLGEHRYLKSYAALKVLQVSLSDEDVQRFLTEAQTLVRLRHPHIVRVLEYAVERGTPVLVMDYAPGGTLRDRHPRGSVLSLAVIVSYVKQMAAALQYAHERYLIHRDIKPENMLLDQDQKVLLSDFGIALFAPTPEALGSQEHAGTWPYMAPEQIQGKATFASDQYALGIVTYEWLCGKRPFEGNQWTLINQHLSTPPPSLRAQYPELPIAVEQVVLKALAKKPEDRFPSVQAFADALERASQGEQSNLENAATSLMDKSPAYASGTTPHTPGISDAQTQQPVFLSAADADAEFAEWLKADLQEQGVLFSNDHVSNVTDQEEAARQAIRAASLVLVVLSPYTRSSRLIQDHMRIANMYGRQITFVWLEGDEAGPLLPIPETWGKTAVIDVLDARESSYALALRKIISILDRDAEISTIPVSPQTKPPREPRNPYKGLRAFSRDEAADFFGRETLIDEMTAALWDILGLESPGMAGTRLLTIIGPSGSGKSSVVMAGLLPRLQEGRLSDSKQWIYLNPLVPGKHPIESLVYAFTPYFSEADVRATLEDTSMDGLHLLATRLAKQADTKVLLVIDQFEELFAQQVPEQEREHFIDLLLTAVTEPDGPVIAVLTLRADFYDRPMRYPKLCRLIEAHHVPVLPMAVHDLRAVIEEPAALPDVQLTLENNLVGDLLFDTQGQAGALPLLEFTLDQLYQCREGYWLTLKAYQEIGGVKGALAKHAEATYASLPSDEHRILARTLFLRLIDPGVTEQDTTRRRASITELSLADEKQTRLIEEVANAFVAARLLITNEIAGETTIEVSHEALIREWSRLATWLREAREDVLMQQAISADAADWIKRGRPADRLYQGTKLTEAQAWAGRNLLSSNEATFLQASAREHERREEEELNRQTREIDLQRRVMSRQRQLVVALSIFLVIVTLAGTLAGVGFLQANAQRQLANQQADIAQSRAFAAQAAAALAKGQVDQALLLSVKANQTTDTFEARDSLLSALEYSPHLLTMLHETNMATYQVTFGSDGQTLITAGSVERRGEISFWNIQTRKSHTLYLNFHGIVQSIPNWAFSPNGQMVAGSNDQGLWLWDARTGAQIARLETANPGTDISPINITPITFSPDSTLLASARCTHYSNSTQSYLPKQCAQGQLLLWHVATQTPVNQQIFNGPALITHLAFSPDGKTVLFSSKTLNSTGTSGSIQVWDVASGKVLTPSFAGFNGIIWNFALSHDGKTLAASDQNKSIYLWNIASQQASTPPLDAGQVQCLAFSPDDKTLASGNAGQTVQLWDVTSGLSQGFPLTGHGSAVTSLVFSADGKTLASSDGSDTVLVWNVAEGSTIQQVFSYPNQTFAAIFSPDGKVVVAGDTNGRVTLTDAITQASLGTLDATSNPNTQVSSPLAIKSLAFSPNKRILAAGRYDGMIFLWNFATKQLITNFHSEQGLRTITFASDSHTLAAAYENGSILLWDTTGRILHRLKHTTLSSNTAPALAFSPDGKTLVYGNNGSVVFWDVARGKPTGQTLTGQGPTITGVAFSPDGKTLATIDQSSAILFWDVSTMKPLSSQPLINSDSDIPHEILSQTGLAFSPDGTLLAVGGYQSATVWNVAKRERIAHAFRTDIRQFTFDSLSYLRGIAFSPDGQQLLIVSDTLSANYMVGLWNINQTSWQTRACNIVNRNLTLGEWTRFVGADTPYRKVCSAFPIDSTVTQNELTQAHADVQAGHQQNAQSTYAQATREAAQLNNGNLANNVCWDGSTDRMPTVVMAACEQAVSLDPYYGQYRDSRGLARALAGNRQGAIDDFKFFAQWATEEYINTSGTTSGDRAHYTSLIKERTAWIQQLEAGQNPFDAKTLKTLWMEAN